MTISTVNLESMNRNQLFKQAKAAGCEVTSKDTKADLMSKILASQDDDDYGAPVADPTAVGVSGVPGAVTPYDVSLSASEQPLAVVRPSQVDELIRRYLDARGQKGTPISEVDKFKFIREHGLPAPRRRYRVTLRSQKGKDTSFTKPVELDAVDEGDAIAQGMDLARIAHKDRHHWHATVVTLEE